MFQDSDIVADLLPPGTLCLAYDDRPGQADTSRDGRGLRTAELGAFLHSQGVPATFFEDICRWEQVPLANPSPIEPDVELAEVGRFRLTRRGKHVRLDVAVDARKFRDLLRVWTRTEAWDWGGD
jgi:hypothetical protein